MGVSWIPDSILKRFAWGREWSVISDMHDKLYKSGNPRKESDMSYLEDMQGAKSKFLRVIARPTYGMLRAFGWLPWHYSMKNHRRHK